MASTHKITTLALALGLTLYIPSALAAFSFGVMSDTQWKLYPGGENTVATGIVDSLNQQFIAKKVKFVIQVGDLVDKEGTNAVNLETRAAHAQTLYDAGIGFYPLRGNHEGSAMAARKFQTLWPQTQCKTDPAKGDHNVAGVTCLGSPSGMDGLSYAFKYQGTTFVVLDQFNRPDDTPQSVLGQDQVDWSKGILDAKPAGENAFVFSHKGLITENHADTLFGNDPSAAPALQNQFMSSLDRNGVHYLFGGHDHMHNRAIVVSPDQGSKVQDITTASNSYKFYIPQVYDPSHGTDINDIRYNHPPRETPIAQQLFTIGYYIVTVDGPRVNVEFYSSPNGCGGDCDLTALPNLKYTKQESFGYSLNGKGFTIPQGMPYTVVEDSFSGTTAKILDGVNGSTKSIYDGRPTTKAVHTGWTPRQIGAPKQDEYAASNILTLWGMAELAAEQTDTYVLAMSYEPAKAVPEQLGKGVFGLATRGADGNWLNAVDRNLGGSKKFVVGKWKSGYELGTYGVDPATKTAWAVVNHNGDFAVARFAK